MKALLHAELLKLRSTRMTAGLLLATLGLVALTVAIECPGGRRPRTRRSLSATPSLLADDGRDQFRRPPVVDGAVRRARRSPRSSATARSPRPTSASRAAAASWSRSGCRWPSPASSSPPRRSLSSVTFGIALIRSRDGDVTVAGSSSGRWSGQRVRRHGGIRRHRRRGRRPGPQPDRRRRRRAGLDERRRADRHPGRSRRSDVGCPGERPVRCSSSAPRWASTGSCCPHPWVGSSCRVHRRRGHARPPAHPAPGCPVVLTRCDRSPTSRSTRRRTGLGRLG